MTSQGLVPPQIGAAAPDFTLRDQHGQEVRLSGLQGEAAALVVFYPFAFSGVCQGELREIRDGLEDFTAQGVQVLAVSCDPMFSLRAWAEAESYHFPLLADFWPHGEVARAYGVFNEQVGAATRGSFLVDRAGVLRWSVVKSMGEARDLEAYREAIGALATG
jgi:peroxiredoxin (alkyl hydroperoxide reductase subunit C)